MFYRMFFSLAFLMFFSSGLANSKNEFLVKVKTQDKIKAIDIILTKRLNEVYGSFFNKAKSKINKNKTITYSINRGTNNIDDRLRYFVETQGKLMAYIDNNETWFTSKDIINAEAGFDNNNNPVLRFALSDEAADQFKKKTLSNIGKVLVFELDGKILTEAKIMQPLSKYITITFTKLELLTRIAILLRTGALPEAVKIVPE